MLKDGLYEQIINLALEQELDSFLSSEKKIEAVDPAEAPVLLAAYLREILERGLQKMDADRQITFIRDLSELLHRFTDDGEDLLQKIVPPARQLQALAKESAAPGQASWPRPVTSISLSSLFTGSALEPDLSSEFRNEILSADRIEFLVSFIKFSGLRLIYDALKEFTERGGALRLITTSYMGATDVRAIEELAKLKNTQIRVSYDTKRTRLHAKAYIFYRATGFTTAYIGSSNLSNPAMSSGLEWNVKITAKDQPHVLRKIESTFETYWADRAFEAYETPGKLREAIDRERGKSSAETDLVLFDLYPYPFQQEILEKLATERALHGRHKNLVVAATGTGKTVISAFDYRRYAETRGELPSLLFVAHREEILKQSLITFRNVLRDANFGDMYTGNHQPKQYKHLFVTVQTLHSKNWMSATDPSAYEFLIIDEFHHAEAPTYRSILDHFMPKILLGLTATPERMDGKNVLRFFDDRIAAEIRLPEAIERRLLCPFHYFGITDLEEMDLRGLRWSRGGYDRAQLSNLYSMQGHVSRRRASLVADSVRRYVSDLRDVIGLGFCVSVAHAEFMAEEFNAIGIPSACLTGKSSQEERNQAKGKLVSGEFRFLFVVDLYNEGVDIPEINTVLFLRPTESLTVFLQQLGRGLRLSRGKECLTVLDFIGHAHSRYDYESKFGSLLHNSPKGVARELKEGFVSVPKGCSIRLEKVAQSHILNNIRKAISTRAGLIERIRYFEEDTGQACTLHNFLHYYGMQPEVLYHRDSFQRLCVEAGVREDFFEPLEEDLKSAWPRLAMMDSERWISVLQRFLSTADRRPEDELFLKMFYVTVWGKVPASFSDEEARENLDKIRQSPVLREEMESLFAYRKDTLDLEHRPLHGTALDLHAHYTRDQLFAALGETHVGVREGVKYLPDKKTDVFLVTLDKAEKDYSSTTMYEDYSVDERHFHWQSQSTTDENSPTGKRYQNHGKMGSKVLLFVREKKTNRFRKAGVYTCLGYCDYVKHEGSKPMSILWKLREPIPAKYLRRTNRLVS